MDTNPLEALSELIRKKNAVEDEIARLIKRPALPGHIGEFVASTIFDIQLNESASHKAIDGKFRRGPLAEKSVNIKWYGKKEGILDITPDALPDFYLVMTGPQSTQGTSRQGTRPWTIEFVFLFPAIDLVNELTDRGVKIGIATSIRKALWRNAEVYPHSHSPYISLLPEQIQQINLFQEKNNSRVRDKHQHISIYTDRGAK